MMISVCIATYNGELFIEEQLKSILVQLGNNDEIIISDDNSSDETINIIKNLNDERIKIFYNTFERGYSNNFQNAIIHSSGEYIFLSDQDDIWKKNKVEIMMSYLKESDFVVSNAEIVDEKLISTNTSYFDLRGKSTGFMSDLIKAKSLGCCMAFTEKVKKRILPFPKNTILCPHDLWILLISEFFFKHKTIDDSLILYRRHNETTSNGGNKSENTLFFKIRYRVYAFTNVLLRI